MPSLDQAGAILEIDLGALVDNYTRLRDIAGPATCAAAVKANAYGIGAPAAVRALSAAGCDTFFVAHIEEGIQLRYILPACRIFVLHGPMPGTEADFHAHRLIPVLNTPEQIADWRLYGRSAGGLSAALHIDTGMNRLGLSSMEVANLIDDPGALDGIRLELVMSHLVRAEEPVEPTNDDQRREFDTLRRQLPEVPASLANSSGIFLGAPFRYDMVRPGAALYGVNPTPGSANPMRQVLRLKGKILQLRKIDRPQTVGYGASYRATRPRTIATVPVGYADGFLRSLGNNGMGVIAGVPVPVVGRVSMDLITVDVSDAPADAVYPGALIELIGDNVPVDEVAAKAGTIGYEILTLLGSRYHRVYVNAPGAGA